MKKPSDLLKESAAPFDLACVHVKSLEDAAATAMDGKDCCKLNGAESNLLRIMIALGLLKVVDGVVKAIKE